MLVGNKVDLVEQDPGLRQVSHEAGCSFADQEGLLFLETSAYSSYNVEHAFEHLLQEVYNERSRATMDGGDALRDDRNVGIGLAEKFHTIRVANSKSDNNCAC
jgi:GTPase SAR1 family protein